VLLIFDGDGVLFESKELHERAFLGAIREYGIKMTAQEHKDLYCGLPTVEKLKRMGFASDMAKMINDRKQELTFQNGKDAIKVPKHIPSFLSDMAADGHKLWMASNACNEFCRIATEVLLGMGAPKMHYLSAESSSPKPSPDIYCEIMSGESARRALVFEDSRYGLEAAFASGADVYKVNDPYDLETNEVRRFIKCLT